MAIRIMPLGDSITSGSGSSDGSGYRGPLWFDLSQGGNAFDFVGAYQSGPGTLPDRDHEGIPYETAQALVSAVPGLMDTYRPDAVLLMIGTQDVQNGLFAQPNGGATLKSEIGQILDQIAARLPSTTVFLSTLPPLSTAENGDAIPAANDAIRAAAATAANKGEHVVLVQPNLTISDLIDGVHPNDAGYAKLAGTWYSAISSAGLASVLQGDEVFRFYNTKTHTHFYTNSVNERDTVMASYPAFRYEGAAFHASATADTGTEVYRFYNTKTHAHFYTDSAAERQYVIDHYASFRYEGVAYYAYEDSGGGAHVPLYRFYNTKTHSHFYTVSDAERQHVADTLPAFRYEGIAYWVDLA
jgi:lysophospholipase L1-like esterase